MTTLTEHDLAVILDRLPRLLAIERAAWHALELAREGHAVDAYAVLSEALTPPTLTGDHS